MRERDLREDLKKGEIRKKYLIVSREQLLIDNLLKTFKEDLNIDEAFDCESMSIREVLIDDIIPRLFLTPFASKYRLIIAKNLEDIDLRTLAGIGQSFRDLKFANILIMTYRADRYDHQLIRRLTGAFAGTAIVDIDAEQPDIDRWIKAKITRDGIDLPADLQAYLGEEFSNDITGLKNEFDKIENYLHETSSLDSRTIKDLAQGLCEVNQYRVAKSFFRGDEDTLAAYREIAPFISNDAGMVATMGRNLLFSATGRQSGVNIDQQKMRQLLKSLIGIDRKIKTGSYFPKLMFEMMFLQNTSLYKKGVSHGKQHG